VNLIRCTRRDPCRICGKHDWCGYNERGSGCMRVESAVPMRNGGFWHPNNGQRNGHRVFIRQRIAVASPVAIDVGKLLAGWRQRQNGELEPFAATLGVSKTALESLGCVYAPEHRAFAFPMRDGQRALTGIRLRNDRGHKWCVTGSKQGLFLPRKEGDDTCDSQEWQASTMKKGISDPNMPNKSASNRAGNVQSAPARTLLIVEGPTDTAAAIDLGFDVIGRPACLGCEQIIADLAGQSGHVTTVIIADNDDPGQRGAAKLQKLIPRSRIVTLPAKDLRSAVQQGMTKLLFEQIISAHV
jgi:hypothetical protein